MEWIIEMDDDYEEEAENIAIQLIKIKFGKPEKLRREFKKKGGEATVGVLTNKGMDQKMAEAMVEMFNIEREKKEEDVK